MKRMPYMSDPTIVPRVQKYLESNVDKTYVDINVMADELQKKYKEYAKRKRSAFRSSVNKAYSIVLESYGLNEESSERDSEDSDENSDSPVEKSSSNFNDSMNNQMVELYKKSAPKGMEENELIDISSDDSEDEPPQPPPPVFGRVLKEQLLSTNKNNSPETCLPGPVAKFPAPVQTNDKGKKRKLDYATITSVKPYQNKKKKQTHSYESARCSFKDIGGMEKTLVEICKLLLHISHPEIYRTIGITPPRGFLLHGPPGSGKTLLANAIAGELNVPLIKVAAPELVAGISGESEERIRELFEQALKFEPCVLFIDEIDAITSSRQNAQKDMEKRIVAQLLSSLDELNKNESGSRVLVIGATNRPDSIDPALRRAGRFDREISLGIPNRESRLDILKVLTKSLKLSQKFDYEKLASYTPGFVGADLLSLVREAAMAAVNRLIREIKEGHQKCQKRIEESKKVAAAVVVPTTEALAAKDASVEIILDDEAPKEVESINGTAGDKPDNPVVVIDEDSNFKPKENPIKSVDVNVAETCADTAIAAKMSTLDEILVWLHDKLPLSEAELKGLCISMGDFETAMKCVQPSAKREGFATVPDVTWEDIGSLREIREELQMSILAPVKHAKKFEEVGLDVPTGVLLCGPPGCGKTLLAKAIANEAGINFISVKGPELLNMYVGESERAVRVCFERARNSSPCVIFFDELDALCPKRSSASEGSATMRVVNQLLTEMDGVGSRKGVFILAASNRPDIIDPAVLRPGRLDKILYVGLPNRNGRVDILKAITKNGSRPKLSPDVNLEEIGSSDSCQGFTGADLAALVREAGVLALKDILCNPSCGDDFAVQVGAEHFNLAFKKIRPSVPETDRAHYEKLRKLYSSLPKDAEVEDMELS